MNSAMRLFPSGHRESHSLVRTTVVVTAVVVGLLVPLGLLGYAAPALFLIFGGILFAVFLRMLASAIARLLPIGDLASLMIAGVLLAALVALLSWWTAPRLSDELDQLVGRLPASLHDFQHKLEQHPLGKWLLSKSEAASANGQQAVVTGARLTASVFEALGSLVIVLFLGMYFAADPHRYVNGLVRLLPSEQRSLVHETLLDAGHSLKLWLIGRLLGMAFVGITVGVGLALMGIPLALLLGVMAGLLGFIPYIGPVVSAVPAVVLGLEQQGLNGVAWIVCLYLGIQTIQDYLLAPVIQEHTVSLPPVVTITSQVFAGIWIGPIGITLATPMAVVLMVLLRRLYIEAYLGDREQTDRVPSDQGGFGAVGGDDR
jgi:predicted PurR-regulated permease PerM